MDWQTHQQQQQQHSSKLYIQRSGPRHIFVLLLLLFVCYSHRTSVLLFFFSLHLFHSSSPVHSSYIPYLLHTIMFFEISLICIVRYALCICAHVMDMPIRFVFLSFNWNHFGRPRKTPSSSHITSQHCLCGVCASARGPYRDLSG